MRNRSRPRSASPTSSSTSSTRAAGAPMPVASSSRLRRPEKAGKNLGCSTIAPIRPITCGQGRRDGLVEDPDRAGVGPDQAQQHPDRRRLARAVRPEEPVHPAERHPQVQPVRRPGTGPCACGRSCAGRGPRRRRLAGSCGSARSGRGHRHGGGLSRRERAAHASGGQPPPVGSGRADRQPVGDAAGAAGAGRRGRGTARRARRPAAAPGAAGTGGPARAASAPRPARRPSR